MAVGSRCRLVFGRDYKAARPENKADACAFFRYAEGYSKVIAVRSCCYCALAVLGEVDEDGEFRCLLASEDEQERKLAQEILEEA
jgi:hypothetical protein